MLARFGLQQASAKAARAPGLDSLNARTETAATRSDLQGRLGAAGSGASSRRNASTCPYYADDTKKSKSAGASAAPTARRSASPASGTVGWAKNGETMLSFSILTLNCDLHPLLSRFHRATNDKGELSP